MIRTGLLLAAGAAIVLVLAAPAAGSEEAHVQAPFNVTGLDAQAEGGAVLLDGGTVPLVSSTLTGSLDVWAKHVPCMDQQESACMWGSADTSRSSVDASGGSLTVVPILDEDRQPRIGITSQQATIETSTAHAMLTLQGENETRSFASDSDAEERMRTLTLEEGPLLVADDQASLTVQGIQRLITMDTRVTLTLNDASEDILTGWHWEETDHPAIPYQRTLTLIYANVNAHTAVSQWDAPLTITPNVPLFLEAEQAEITVDEGTIMNTTGETNETIYDARITITGAQTNPDDEPPMGWFIATQGMVTPSQPTPDEDRVSTLTVAGATGTVIASTALLAYYWPRASWITTIGLMPLYSRIKKDDLLNHDVRRALFNLVKDDPGIHAHALSEASETGWGTTVYHLRRLEKNGFVTSEKKGRYRRFFPASGFLERTREVLSLLQNDTTNQVAKTILEDPGLNQSSICEKLDISPSLANWHINRLLDAELVERNRQGRTVHYTPGPTWSEIGEAVDLPIEESLLNEAMPA